MRLFIFLVGGTGSRVMRPLVMQLAAGILPRDTDGTAIPLEVVPIIVDPHNANEDLKRTENMMRWYQQIRHALYGDGEEVRRGFFAARISTLADIVPESSGLSKTFLFNMGTVSSRKFGDFISYSTLDSGNQALASMLFSADELDTRMDIGFVGSPNIGSVAMGKFKDSEEFRQFSNIFRAEDRIFVVSSIFGGTGAAGYPVIVKNIRAAASNSTIQNRGDLRDARIGALTVLPYFNLQQDEKSPISRTDFISKTKSALYYYHDNLTGLTRDGEDLPLSKVNACYYLGDEIPSRPYFNDPGGGGQRNDAHMVEYVGALAILDFLQIPDDQLRTIDGKAQSPIFREYGLAEDKMQLTLKDFGLPTRQMVSKPLAMFHLAYLYITHRLRSDIGRGYTEDKPEIGRSLLSSTFFTTLTSDFFVAYLQWLMEMRANQRSFMPFDIDTEKLGEAIAGISPKTSFFHSAIDYNTLLARLNRLSQRAAHTRQYNERQTARRLMELLWQALDELADEKYQGIAS